MSSSSAPPPAKEKKKTKKEIKPSPDEHGKDEGTNPHWDYKPPTGVVLLDHTVDSEFDWDTVKNDENIELWLIRVPEDLKLRSVHDVKVQVPSSSSHSARIGSINKKNTVYDIWSIGEDELPVGGEEIKGLSCLLPRKKKGNLYAAPKPIVRHVVISAHPPDPHVDPATLSQLLQNPPRYSYPKEYLRHRFLPYGAQTPLDDGSGMDMDVEMEKLEVVVERALPTESSPEVKKVKGKKRKVEGETPKRTKKPRVTA